MDVILSRLDVPALETIRESISKVREGNLCALDIEEKAGTIVFSVDQLPAEIKANCYHTPGYYLGMIDDQIFKKGMSR